MSTREINVFRTYVIEAFYVSTAIYLQHRYVNNLSLTTIILHKRNFYQISVTAAMI